MLPRPAQFRIATLTVKSNILLYNRFWLVDVNFSDFFEFSRVTNTRGHAYKLYKSHCNHSTRSRFFAE